MTVRWSERADRVLAGDLTAALAYLTPAGGSVVTAVAPIGLRDRDRGELTFTTSLGFGRKLDRIRRSPHVALLYHAREHGFHEGTELVLVQGTARIVERPDRAYLDDVVGPAAEPFMGAPRRGVFWDRWLQEYYSDRVPVHVDVERVAVWPALDGGGEPEVEGAPWPAAWPPPQAPPRNGAGPRVDVARAARRARPLRHALLGWRGMDGYPAIVPVTLGEPGPRGIPLTSARPLPPGGRRAGLLAHDYNAQLVGLRVRQFTGWFEDGVYAPHTEQGFRAPANKTLLLLANGFMAKRGLRKARKAAASAAA
ncbi:MAG TPA: pyridoxamine 5'-phosphate oxidase family protein [Solirubrobacteraceae bacterium]